MKKLKKYLAVGFGAIMIVTAAGCSGSTSSNTTQESTNETSNESTNETSNESTTESTQDASKTETSADTSTETKTDDSILVGKVTAIDGTSITLALGEIPQGNGMRNSEASAATDDKSAQSNTSTTSTDTTTQPSNTTKPDESQAPSGNKGAGQVPTGEKPSGEAPSGDGQATDMSALFEENGETKTINIEDESLIKIMSGSETTISSLSDIAVDTILAIEYDDSDNITLITIQSVAK